MIKDLSDLLVIRHSQIIKDPFPAHTEYGWKYDAMSAINKFFGVKADLETPEDISIWKAYQMGYDQAYKEIETSLHGK